MREALQLAFYKGVGGKFGALQFNPQKPHYYCEDCKAKIFEATHLPVTGCPNGNCKHNGDKSKRMKTREGCVFVEVANTASPNVYDWKNKTTIALSINDMAEFLLVLEGQKKEASITHDPGAKSATQGQINKRMSVASPKGIVEGGVLVNVSFKHSNDERKYMIPLNPAETKRLAVCMRQAISTALNW